MKNLLDNKIFKIIFGIVKLIFVVLICLYLAFIIIQNVSGNRSVFGYRMFDIASSSMSGVYEVHDVILVKDYDTNKLKVGEDIVYNGERAGLDGKLVTHRIIKIENNEKDGGRVFTTKGVKNEVEDPAIKDDQIIGKVVGIVPVISPVNHIVKSQVGFFLCVFCPIVIIISLEVFATLTEMKEEKLEIEKEEKKETDEAKENDDEKETEEEIDTDEAKENDDEKETEEEIDTEEEKENDDEKETEEEKENDDEKETEEEIEVLDIGESTSEEDNDEEELDENNSEDDDLVLKIDKFKIVDDDE